MSHPLPPPKGHSIFFQKYENFKEALNNNCERGEISRVFTTCIMIGFLSQVPIGIFQVLQEEGDSPPVVFNVTISNIVGSLYHARNVTVRDTTRGMDFYDSDISTKGAFVSSPIRNTFVVTFTLPSLKGK